MVLVGMSVGIIELLVGVKEEVRNGVGVGKPLLIILEAREGSNDGGV